MSQERIIIVGAGIVGLSTAYTLLQQGIHHVMVIEQAAVDHARATSTGLSRLLRFEYGADRLYSRMVQLSLQLWKKLEHISDQTLYTRTGLLVLGKGDDQYVEESFTTLQEMGLPSVPLSQEMCRQLYPQFRHRGYDQFTYNANAGLLHASRCLRTLKGLIQDLGGTIVEGQQVTQITHHKGNHPIRLHLQNGSECQADRVLLATGPWVHRLLGHLHLPIRPTRQYLLYYANLPVSEFKIHTFPAFIAGDLYGFPIHSTCAGDGPSWLKVASHAFGTTVNPDDPLTIDQHTIESMNREVCHLLPSLQNATLAHIGKCMYDASPDEDFILDHLPDDPRIVFATGLTGHGFKFGPLLGSILSSLLQQAEPPVPLDRFRLDRFSTSQQPPEVAVCSVA